MLLIVVRLILECVLFVVGVVVEVVVVAVVVVVVVVVVGGGGGGGVVDKSPHDAHTTRFMFCRLLFSRWKDVNATEMTGMGPAQINRDAWMTTSRFARFTLADFLQMSKLGN